MNPEQLKINKFFNKLTVNGTQRTLAWIGIVCLIILTIMLCALPAQDIYSDIGEGPLIIPGVMTMFSYWMLYLRTSHYKTYIENQKGRIMTELLQYHPVSKRELWKEKNKCGFFFMAKITFAGLLIQLISSYANCETISVLDFIHIILCVFLFPMAGEILFDCIVGTIWKE